MISGLLKGQVQFIKYLLTNALPDVTKNMYDPRIDAFAFQKNLIFKSFSALDHLNIEIRINVTKKTLKILKLTRLHTFILLFCECWSLCLAKIGMLTLQKILIFLDWTRFSGFSKGARKKIFIIRMAHLQ